MLSKLGGLCVHLEALCFEYHLSFLGTVLFTLLNTRVRGLLSLLCPPSAAPAFLPAPDEVELVFVIQMHVGPEAVLVAVDPLADGTHDLYRGLAALPVVPAHVHGKGVGVLHLFVAVGTNGPPAGRSHGLGDQLPLLLFRHHLLLVVVLLEVAAAAAAVQVSVIGIGDGGGLVVPQARIIFPWRDKQKPHCLRSLFRSLRRTCHRLGGPKRTAAETKTATEDSPRN